VPVAFANVALFPLPVAFALIFILVAIVIFCFCFCFCFPWWEARDARGATENKNKKQGIKIKKLLCFSLLI